MSGLNQEQRNQVRKYIQHFKEYENTEAYKEDIEDKKMRTEKFSAITLEIWHSMNEFDLGEIFSMLWAANAWVNKDYFVNKIIADNSLNHIKKELGMLLFNPDDIVKNFNRTISGLKNLGPASITELLCYFHPDQFGIWNNRARAALKILGFEKTLPLDTYEINGEQYQQFNSVLKEIVAELKKAGYTDADLLFANYFLYEVGVQGEIPSKPPILPTTFDHNEVRDYIRNIGTWLGFEAEIEKHIGPGARVDVVWKAQISNLGVVNYIFEVHKSGSIDSLIVNLQKSKRNPTVQKIIAVSDKNQLDTIKKEITGLPEEFVSSMAYWNVEDVIETYQKLQDVFAIINRLELVKSEFNKQ